MKFLAVFRYTEAEGNKLGVVGWVKNTRQGTVQGQVQGPEERVNSMSNKEIENDREGHAVGVFGDTPLLNSGRAVEPTTCYMASLMLTRTNSPNIPGCLKTLSENCLIVSKELSGHRTPSSVE
ncbi:acylphosphatase-2 isoform X3 [Ranitomeya imitator]|uniref:acylphosphatase-2 isoform X3 n=1 Tax=Ranitomeya imitator TaxID=111125 RepID=UPI0037E8292B